jgi:hypothetical protein
MKTIITAFLAIHAVVFANVYLELAPGCTTVGNTVTVNIISSDSMPWCRYLVIRNAYGCTSYIITKHKGLPGIITPIEGTNYYPYPPDDIFYLCSEQSPGILPTGIYYSISFTMFAQFVTVELYDESFEYPLNQLTITPPLDPSVSAHAGGPYVIYKDGSVILNGSGSTSCGMNIDDYIWEIDGFYVGSGQTVTIDYINLPEALKLPGTHNVKLRVSGIYSFEPEPLMAWDENETTLEAVRSFDITSPAIGDAWNSGGLHLIQWDTLGNVANVKIEYSVDGESNWTLIVQTANSGSYNWIVPKHASQNCRIRITDVADSRVIKTSELFTIYECTLLSDLNNDCFVNLEDFSILASKWLSCGDPFDFECVQYLDNRFILTSTVINDYGGTIYPTSDIYDVNEIVNLTANPDLGYAVKAWTGTDNDASTSNTNTVTMTSNKTIMLEFEVISHEVIVTTADGLGADGGVSNDYTQGPAFLLGTDMNAQLRRYDGSRARAVILRFDVHGVDKDISGVTLSFTTSLANRERTLNIYVLTDDSLDNWNEANLCYNTAPGLIHEGEIGYTLNYITIDESKWTLTGTMPISEAVGLNTYSIDPDIIVNDGNGLLTLLLYTSTSDTTAYWYVVMKESINNPPTLTISKAH